MRLCGEFSLRLSPSLPYVIQQYVKLIWNPGWGDFQVLGSNSAMGQGSCRSCMYDGIRVVRTHWQVPFDVTVLCLLLTPFNSRIKQPTVGLDAITFGN